MSISEGFLFKRLFLRQQSNLLHQSISEAGEKEFTSLLTQQMSNYSLLEVKMIITGYFMNYELGELSPWLLLFSSTNYLTKLQIAIKMFGKCLSITTMGINSSHEYNYPLSVSLAADLDVLSAVTDTLPDTSIHIKTHSAQLLRDAIDFKSNLQIIPVLNFLYENKVNLNAKSVVRRESALIYAIRSDRKLTVSWLIEHQVDLNSQDNYGFTALHYAVLSSVISCVDLLQAGADPNIQSHDGVTALFLQFSSFWHLFYTSKLLPIEISNNSILKMSIDKSILEEFVKSGAKVLSTSSRANPKFNISVLAVQYPSRSKISDNFDISVTVLFNSYDCVINVFNLERTTTPMRLSHRKLLCVNVKHGISIAELNFQNVDSCHSDSFTLPSIVGCFLTYFEKPYTSYVFCTLVRYLENVLDSAHDKLFSDYDYLITTVIEVGSNSRSIHRDISLYHRSLCVILQLLTRFSQSGGHLFLQVCRYVEMCIQDKWYKQMQTLQRQNDPSYFLCVQIGCWMSLFMYIWYKSDVHNNRANHSELERFYRRISCLCEEFQPLMCMTLYTTHKYYVCRCETNYDNSVQYMNAIYKRYSNFVQETVSLLIRFGEDINLPTYYRKQTPLLIAVESNASEMFLRFLLEQGASPYAVDALGYSIKEYCDIGIVSKRLHVLVNQVTVMPYSLQLLSAKCLVAHKIYVGCLFTHNSLRNFLIVHT